MKKIILFFFILISCFKIYSQKSFNYLRPEITDSTYLKQFWLLKDNANTNGLISLHNQLSEQYNTETKAIELLFIQNNIAQYFTNNEILDTSDSLLNAARINYKKYGDTVSFEYGHSYDLNCINALRRRDMAASMHYEIKKAAVWDKLNIPTLKAATLLSRAAVMNPYENLSEIITMIDSSIEISRRHNFLYTQFKALSTKGNMLSNYDCELGAGFMIQANDIFYKMKNADKRLLVTNSLRIGSAYAYDIIAPDLEKGLKWYMKTKKLFDEEEVKDPYQELILFLNLADIESARKNYMKSLEYLNISEKIFLEHYSTNNPLYGELIYRQGSSMAQLKQAGSIEKLDEAIRYFEKENNNYMLLSCKIKKTIAYKKLGEDIKAIKFMHRLLSFALEGEESENYFEAPSITEIDPSYMATCMQLFEGKDEILKKLYSQSKDEKLLKAIYDNNKSFILFNEKMSITQLQSDQSLLNLSDITNQRALELLAFCSQYNLNDNYASQIWDVISVNKSYQLLTQKYISEEVEKDNTNSDKTIIQSIQKIKNELDKYSDQTSEAYKKLYNNYLIKTQKLFFEQFNKEEEEMLPVTEEKGKVDLNEFSKINIAQVQSKLNEKTIIIDYYQSDTLLSIFSITKDTISLKFVKNKDIKTLKQQLIYKVKTGKQLSPVLLNQLYAALIKPVESNLKNKENLIIIPTGELYNLPFELLPSYTTNKYLINDIAISYNYSVLLRDINERTIRNNNGGLLAMAPGFIKKDICTISSNSTFRDVYESDTLTAVFRDANRNKLTALPWSVKEVKEAHKIWSMKEKICVLKTNEEANELIFKEKVEDFKIIHLATHGYTSNSNPNKSGLFFSQQENSKEDGFLQMGELFNMKLNAELVVLSACKSGSGPVAHGEGVLSLPRGFLFNGVPNIICSLWNVNDKKSFILINEFYINLAAGDNYSRSLQKAKIKCIEQGYIPLDWSGTILIGQ